MTSGIPRRPSRGEGAVPRTGPVAHVSLSALRTNLRAVLGSGAGNGAVIDVRADAWGHGIHEVCRVALEAGASALLVDEDGARALRGTVDPARLVRDGEGRSPEAVYGLSPGFTPVLSLVGRVLSLKALHESEGVSYGYTYRAPADSTIALVSGGYAQGIVRALGNAAHVTLTGERHPIIGRVAMDVCVVDVGSSGVVRGDEVVFFGDPATGAPALSEWTAATGFTSAELVAAIGQRNERVHG